MREARPLIAIGLAVALFAVAGCGGDDPASTETTATETTDTTGDAVGTLIGIVGPGFTISLANQDGTAVTTLPAGSYTIEIDDKSFAHNFHLSGEGVDEATDVGAEERVTWELELVAGSYTYVCDPHASTMNGSFEVTA